MSQGLGDAVRRRDFVKAAAISAATWPLAARAQTDKVRLLGATTSLAENDPEGKAYSLFQGEANG